MWRTCIRFDRFNAYNLTIGMASGTVQALRWLQSATGQAELQEIVGSLPLQPNAILKLRKRLGQERTDVLLSTAEMVAPTTSKFGFENRSGSSIFFATARALQQSTDWRIANYKANRFPKDAVVFDLCSGIGGDSVGLARRGKVVAVDCDPIICTMCAHNLSLSGANAAVVICDAIENLESYQFTAREDYWFHADPDRRPDGNKTSNPQYCQPPANVFSRWIDRCEGGAIKLSPAASLAKEWRYVAEREWISFAGSCRQQVAWIHQGEQVLQDCLISATRILNDGTPISYSSSNAVHREFDLQGSSMRGQCDDPAVKNYMFDFDPAVRAAGLSAAFGAYIGAQSIESPAGFFTADNPVVPASDIDSNLIRHLASCFEVLDVGSPDEKRLRRVLASFRPKSLEIKVRGGLVTPESLRPKLIGKRQQANRDERDLTLLIGRGYAAIAVRVDLDHFLVCGNAGDII